MEHFTDLFIIEDEHQLTVFSHSALRHCNCVILSPHPSHDDGYAPKAALQQIFFGCEDLALFDFPRVIFEFKKHVSAVEVINDEFPEFGRRSYATDVQ